MCVVGCVLICFVMMCFYCCVCVDCCGSVGFVWVVGLGFIV